MALARDNSSIAGVGGSGTFTIGGSANIALAFVSQFGNTTAPSITLGGQSMTLIGASGQQNSLEVWAFYLINPPTGSQSYSTTFGGGANSAAVITYSGAKSSGQPDANTRTTFANNQHPNPSVTTISDNDWVVLGWYTDGTFSSLTNATQQGSITNGFGLADSNGPITPPGSDTQTINLTGTNNTAVCQIAIAPTPPVGGGDTGYAYFM